MTNRQNKLCSLVLVIMLYFVLFKTSLKQNILVLIHKLCMILCHNFYRYDFEYTNFNIITIPCITEKNSEIFTLYK